LLIKLSTHVDRPYFKTKFVKRQVCTKKNQPANTLLGFKTE